VLAELSLAAVVIELIPERGVIDYQPQSAASP
jgi:hypothetical protein